MTSSVSDSKSSTANTAVSEPSKPAPREPGVGQTRSRADILAAQAIASPRIPICKAESLGRSISGQE